MSDRKKDIWEKTQILSQLAIAAVALVFTFIFSNRQAEVAEAQLRVAQSNYAIAKSQADLSREGLKSTLIPLLTGSNPVQRDIAFSLAQSLDPQFAVVAARVFAVGSPDPGGRQNARATLGEALLGDLPAEGKQSAERAIGQFNVMNELRSKKLLTGLYQARVLLDTTNALDQEEALKLYRSVLSQLSDGSRGSLDQRVLKAAESAYQQGQNAVAVRLYGDVFAPFREAGTSFASGSRN